MNENPASPDPGPFPFTHVCWILTGTLGVMLVGANVLSSYVWINSLVYPDYMNRMDRIGDWIFCAVAGAVIGFVPGIFFGILYAGFASLVTDTRCPFLLGLKYQVGILLATLAFWMLGGFLKLGLTLLAPAYFLRHADHAVGAQTGDLYEAWLGGSVYGVTFGGLAAFVGGLFLLHRHYRGPMA